MIKDVMLLIQKHVSEYDSVEDQSVSLLKVLRTFANVIGMIASTDSSGTFLAELFKEAKETSTKRIANRIVTLKRSFSTPLLVP